MANKEPSQLKAIPSIVSFILGKTFKTSFLFKSQTMATSSPPAEAKIF